VQEEDLERDRPDDGDRQGCDRSPAADIVLRGATENRKKNGSAGKEQAHPIEAIKREGIDRRIAKVAFENQRRADLSPLPVQGVAERRPHPPAPGGHFGEIIKRADKRETADQQRNPDQQTDHDGAEQHAQHRPRVQSVPGSEIRAGGAQEREIAARAPQWGIGLRLGLRRGRRRRRHGRSVVALLRRRAGRPIGKIVRAQAEGDRIGVGRILARMPRPPPLQRGGEVAAARYAGNIVEPLEQIVLGQGLQDAERQGGRPDASTRKTNAAPGRGLNAGTEPLRPAERDLLPFELNDLRFGLPSLFHWGGLRRLTFRHETPVAIRRCGEARARRQARRSSATATIPARRSAHNASCSASALPGR
jgi:hypothetical protein